jgi:muramoyltetrapeptide carboxypeptidase
VITRRRLLGTAGLAGLASLATAPHSPAAGHDRGQPPTPGRRPTVRPPRLGRGDTVGLIDPASATFESVDIQIVTEALAALGLKARPGANLMARYGYLAGTDQQRAADVNAFFADPDVRALVAVRGGWGCARMIPHVDYTTVARNPKALIGYSDITALHMALHARTGLITFHAPVGLSAWGAFSVDSFRRIVFEGEAVTLRNQFATDDRLAQRDFRIQTITPGKARGRLLGGNLTVLSAIIGTPYLPDFEGSILFLEDIDERIYRVDRMLTQLALSGILGRVRGVVFGHCTNCAPGDGGFGSLTLEEVLRDHLAPLGVPAFSGAMIGHIRDQFTVPIGVEAEIDAGAGTITMLESAVAP